MFAKFKTLKLATVAFATLLAGGVIADTINIAGWGAKSGPLRSFGINSEAIIKAAIDRVNENGGVKLADGSMAKMSYDYYDSACNAEQGIALSLIHI